MRTGLLVSLASLIGLVGCGNMTPHDELGAVFGAPTGAATGGTATGNATTGGATTGGGTTGGGDWDVRRGDVRSLSRDKARSKL